MPTEDGAEKLSTLNVKSMENISMNWIKKLFGIKEKLIRVDVYIYLEEGRKVNSIKAVRAATGMGLKEAKLAIDELMEGGDEYIYIFSFDNLRDAEQKVNCMYSDSGLSFKFDKIYA